MKILIEESVLRQALEALESIGDEWGFTSKRTLPSRQEAVTALRSALDAAEKVEPVARLHVTETDEWPDIRVEVLNGESLQPAMSPIAVFTYPAPAVPEDEIERLRAERDELVADAKRYRWLRDKLFLDGDLEETTIDVSSVWEFGTFLSVDKFIDAALAKLGAGETEEVEQDLYRCPSCGGPADNGFSRKIPPSPYYCTKCMEKLK